MPRGSSRTDVIEAIYAAAAAPDRWPTTLTVLADFIGAIGGMVAYHPEIVSSGFLVTGRLRQDLSDLYMRQYTKNPFAVSLRTAPKCQPLLGRALVDMARVRRSAFHQDILLPQKIDDQVSVVHPSLSLHGGSGGIAFMLTQRQADDSTRLLRRFEPLIPHLVRAVDVSLDLGRSLVAGSQLHTVLSAMASAALLVDDRGGVGFANAAGEVLLAEDDGLALRKSDILRLTAADRGEDRTLARAIQSSISVTRGDESAWSGTVRVTRPSGRPPLTVLTTPLPAPFHPFGLAIPRRACVLVQVLDPSKRPARQSETLKKAFGLTPAEARVASLVGSGRSAPEVARLLGVSVTTVKSHLARSFDKLDVRSQLELACFITGLPPDPSERAMISANAENAPS